MNMQTTKKHLLEPFDLGDLTLSNRVVLSPMTRSRSGEYGIPNTLMAEYYAQRSCAGLIITEGANISAQAMGWNRTPGIYTDQMVDGWKRIVDAIHAGGSRVFLQLWHTGRASHSDFHPGELPVAPSAIALNGEYIHTPEGKQSYEVPRALETDEISNIVEDYRRAAEGAKAAGFDGVEIHSANGYLLDQFLQSKTNHRTDVYGGSIENRYRFLGEVVDAVTKVFPVNRVAVRLSPNGNFNDMGSPDFREQFAYAARQLDQYGLGYLHVLDGLGFGFHELGDPMTLRDFRNIFHGPLIGNVGYTQETAEVTIAGGDADLIAFGRPFISNPDLVDRFANDWPLAEPAAVTDWYSFDEKGYTDFPTYAAT